jgi:hypothetical protein
MITRYSFKEQHAMQAHTKQYWQRLVAVVGLMAGLMILPVSTVSARNNNPGVLPPNSHPHGLTYGEWSAKWWQFVFSLPAPNNPLLFDDQCTSGQTGPVWFLTGKLCVAGVPGETCSTTGHLSATRDCTIPPGKALFFPIANGEADNLGVDPPWTLEQLRQQVKGNQDSVTSMTCEIDGVPIQGLSSDPDDPSPYRVVSPVFSYTIPDNNVYQFLGLDPIVFGAQTVPVAVADGVFLMLAPLSVGQHVIRFTASFNFGFGFDITYNITVSP